MIGLLREVSNNLAGASRSWMLIALLTTLACGEPEDRSTEAGECLDAAAVEGAAELAYTELSAELDDDWFSESLVEVLTTQQALDAFEAAHGLEIAEVIDFSVEQVLVAGVSIGNTCGAHTSVVRVLDLDGAAYLEVEVTNPNGTCDVCDMSGTKFVAVSVAAGPDASACARLIETCGE